MQMPGKLGYDRAIVVFSPDGRLFQVEYAREAVKRGPTSLGITYKKGVVFAGIKHVDELSMENGENKKIHQIDEHIGVATSGIIADSRVLVDKARIKAQVYKITYDEPIDVYSLVKEIADLKQMHTQLAGLRPMGVSLLVGGVNDKDSSLFETDPGGAMFGWKAQAIGKKSSEVRDFLKKKWKENLTREKALSLAVKALKKAEKDLNEKTLDLAYIEKEGFERLGNKEKKKHL